MLRTQSLDIQLSSLVWYSLSHVTSTQMLFVSLLKAFNVKKTQVLKMQYSAPYNIVTLSDVLKQKNIFFFSTLFNWVNEKKKQMVVTIRQIIHNFPSDSSLGSHSMISLTLSLQRSYLVILHNVCHTIHMKLVRRIWYWIN